MATFRTKPPAAQVVYSDDFGVWAHFRPPAHFQCHACPAPLLKLADGELPGRCPNCDGRSLHPVRYGEFVTTDPQIIDRLRACPDVQEVDA